MTCPNSTYLSGLTFSHAEQVIRVEINQCLQVVSSCYSFSTTESDNNRFKIMFTESV